MQVFKRYVSARSLTVFACEILIIFGSIAVAAGLHGPAGGVPGVVGKIALMTALCLVCLYYNDFYDLTLVHSNRELIVRLFQSAGAAAIILAALTLIVPSLVIGRGIFVSSLVLFLLTVTAWRVTFNQFSHAPRLEERILIVGTGPAARSVAAQILAQREFGYHIVGFVDDDPATAGQIVAHRPVIGSPADIARLVARYEVDRIIVGLTDRRGKLPIEELLKAKLAGVRVEDAMTTYERVAGKILIDDLKPSWLIFSDGFRARRLTRALKRLLDLSLGSLGLLLAAPLVAGTALAVRLGSDGPILYRQERVGENGRPFTLFKFRSMRVDAESGTPVWASDGDDRVTPVGRFIRRTRLDELPQLWNVLRGDMSFVGPRPERLYFVDRLSKDIPFYVQRHAVKPGVTGWAQVKYRYGSSVEDAMEKLRYDLYYIKHMSIVFDLSIIFDTVKVVLFPKGAK